jgi:hypothetical protein
MAFSSILSNSMTEPAPSYKQANSTEVPSPPSGRKIFDEAVPSSPPRPVLLQNAAPFVEEPTQSKTNGEHVFVPESIPVVVKLEKTSGTSDKENDEIAAAAAAIDEGEASDLELAEFSPAQARFKDKSRKRLVEIERIEHANRKVCYLIFRERLSYDLTLTLCSVVDSILQSSWPTNWVIM